MDTLSQRSEQELRSFFRRKRTELSCLREPERLLNQLRDLDVIAEDQPEKVIQAKNKERALYQLLQQLEEKTPHKIRDFWECAFKEHILEIYPEVKSLKEELFASVGPRSGEKCVLSENRWFTPNEFQKFGGKDSYRNWKGSIQYKGKSLGVLIK
uniref:SAND domain-containing protein n=1 Tax=Lepisosteus oculatus TaxID=7918 RepID=W5N1B9_LEPOC